LIVVNQLLLCVEISMETEFHRKDKSEEKELFIKKNILNVESRM